MSLEERGGAPCDTEDAPPPVPVPVPWSLLVTRRTLLRLLKRLSFA